MTPSPAHYHGPIPPKLWDLLERCWERGVSVQSDYARSNPAEVALAASCGFISSLTPCGTAYGRLWRITVAGLTALQNKDLYV